MNEATNIMVGIILIKINDHINLCNDHYDLASIIRIIM